MTDDPRALAERVLDPLVECDLGDDNGPCEQCRLARDLARALLDALDRAEAAERALECADALVEVLEAPHTKDSETDYIVALDEYKGART